LPASFDLLAGHGRSQAPKHLWQEALGLLQMFACVRMSMCVGGWVNASIRMLAPSPFFLAACRRMVCITRLYSIATLYLCHGEHMWGGVAPRPAQGKPRCWWQRGKGEFTRGHVLCLHAVARAIVWLSLMEILKVENVGCVIPKTRSLERYTLCGETQGARTPLEHVDFQHNTARLGIHTAGGHQHFTECHHLQTVSSLCWNHVQLKGYGRAYLSIRTSKGTSMWLGPGGRCLERHTAIFEADLLHAAHPSGPSAESLVHAWRSRGPGHRLWKHRRPPSTPLLTSILSFQYNCLIARRRKGSSVHAAAIDALTGLFTSSDKLSRSKIMKCHGLIGLHQTASWAIDNTNYR